MRRLFRLIGAAGLVVAVLSVLAFVAMALIPSERIARLAIDRFEAVTGRGLSIEGAVRPSLWPVLGVETGRIVLQNAEWSDSGPMLVADAMSLRLDLSALMGGAVRLTGFALTRPEILLERSADGVPNWVFGGENGGTAGAGMAGANTPFTLEGVTLREGRMAFIDHETGREVEIAALDAELSLADYEGPLDIALNGEVAGQSLALEARLGAFRQAYEGGVVPVALGMTLGAARVAFEGRGSVQDMAAEGVLDAELGDLSAVAAVLGAAPFTLPDGFGARSVAVSGTVTRSGEGDLYLRGGRIGLDDTVLTGDLDLVFGGARPRLTGRLATEALEIGSDAQGGAQGGSGSEGRAGGWPDAPLSVDGLGLVDATLGLSAQRVRLGRVEMTGLRGSVTVENARAVFDLGTVGAYGGTVSGQVVANARKGLSIGGRLDLAGVAMQPLLADVAGYDRLIATGDAAVDFVAAGGSVAEVMRRLDGEGRLALGPGEIRGIDVQGLLSGIDLAGGGGQTAVQTGPQEKTVFDALSASFTVEGGELLNDDLALQSPYLRATGAGRVGIGARDFDYRLRATALQGADGVDMIAVPVRITGPWEAPRIALDLEALAEARFGEQARAAEDELRRRAAEELGQQSGESLEDAARRKLREELDAQAGDLLRQLLGAE